MSVAIRAITRVQDADDLNVSLGAGVDEYALCWDNDTERFVLRAISGGGVTDHGALTGLSDDDHTGYALLAGRAGGQTLYGGDAANDDITIHGTSNATRTTSNVLLQPSGGKVGIGKTDPGYKLDILDSSNYGSVRITGSGGGGFVLGSWNSSTGGFWSNGLTPGSINYCLLANNTGNTFLNAASGQMVYIINANGNNPGQLLVNENGVSVNNSLTGATSGNGLIVGSGNVGIGTTAPATLLHGLLTSSATNAVTNVLTIGHDTSGTAANGFGAGALFRLESSTTTAQSAARIQALWYEATHTTRKADLVLTAYDTAEREGLRIRGNGSAAAIAFLGATPAARVAHVADPAGGGTVDAEARSAINSILATLETFGLHATS